MFLTSQHENPSIRCHENHQISLHIPRHCHQGMNYLAILSVFTSLLFLLTIACYNPSDNPLPAQQHKDTNPTTPMVVLSNDGFTPKRLDVSEGQLVRFVNNSDERMWIASNIHPTHEIYPEFDTKQPISSGGDWVFNFKINGFWRYHNHMSPENGGIVVVSGGTPRKIKPLVIEKPNLDFKIPKSPAPTDYINLFKNDKSLLHWIKEYGPAATVETLSNGQEFIEIDCHQRAHDLGRYAYEIYGAYAFALASHQCQAGSLHGSTEALFRDRGTANLEADVAALCSNTPNRFFHHQCVHGVGHGLLAWTSYELPDTLPMCDQLKTKLDRESCYSGVFMENIVGGLSGGMGHITEYLSDDPHYPCNTLEKRYISPCYYYQTSRMIQLFNRDFKKLASACSQSPDDAHRNCFLSMGRDVGQETRGDPKASIELCGYVIGIDNRASCIEGAVQDRFWDIGGANEAMALCNLVKEEASKTGCYNVIIQRGANLFANNDSFHSWCRKVEKRYLSWCDNESAKGVE